MSDEFNCLICLEVCEDAVATNCCHQLYCETCISRCETCPNCRKRPFSTYISIPVRRIIGNQKVSCELCDHVVTRADLVQHKKKFCEKRLMSCNLCHFAYPSCSLEAHKRNECPNRKVNCTQCQVVLNHVNVESHKTERCPRRMVTCNTCTQQLPFVHLRAHARRCRACILCRGSFPGGCNREVECSQCGEEVSPCAMRDHLVAGCPVLCAICYDFVRRDELYEHMQDCLEEYSICELCDTVVELDRLPFPKDSPSYRDTLEKQMEYHQNRLCPCRND